MVAILKEEGLISVGRGIPMRRVWAMPNANTFSVAPIGSLVKSYLRKSTVSVDPFARNNRWATHTNDLNPKTNAEHHMDAEDFLYTLRDKGIKCDLAIMDPPYSPRQITECYKEAGITVGMKETQNAALYARCEVGKDSEMYAIALCVEGLESVKDSPHSLNRGHDLHGGTIYTVIANGTRRS